MKETKPLLIVVLIYFTTNFLLLLNKGIYWDEHTWNALLSDKRYAVFYFLLEHQKQYAQYYLSRFFYLFSNPIFVEKVIVFISGLISCLLVYLIAKKICKLGISDSVFISTIFISVPLYMSKINGAIALYSVCMALFLLGAYLLLRGYIFLSLPLFFLSFFTNSLLVYFGGVILLYWWLNKNENNKNTKTYVVLFALPIIFWLVKMYFGQPYGFGAEYNRFISGSQFLTPLLNDLWSGISYGLLWPIHVSLAILDRKIFSVIFGACIVWVYFLIKRLNKTEEVKSSVSQKGILLSGSVAFLLGLLPYLAVGKAPFPFGFSMRHAFLLPLGFSLLLLGVVKFIVTERYQRNVQIVLVSLFITFTIYSYFRLDMDWYRQIAMVEILRNANLTDTEIINGASTIVFRDNMEQFNWQNRKLSSSDYFGITRLAFHRQDLLAVNEDYSLPYTYQIFENIIAYPPFAYDKKIVHITLEQATNGDLVTVNNWIRIKLCEFICSPAEYTKTLTERIPTKLNVAVISN